MELDTIKYINLNAHVSGSTKIWNTDLWKSFTQYPTGAIYDPITYNYRIGHAVLFYKNMLIRRQRVLLLGSIEKKFAINGPFSHLFLTSIWIGGTLTNYRKLQTHLRYFGTFIDILNYLESTQYNIINLKKIIKRKKVLSISLNYQLSNYFLFNIPNFLFSHSNILYNIDFTFNIGYLRYHKKKKVNLLKVINTIRYKQRNEIFRYLYLLLFSYYFFKTSLKFNMGLFLADAETLELAPNEVTQLTALDSTKIYGIPFLFEQFYITDALFHLSIDISLYKLLSKIYQDTQIFKKLFYYFFKKSEHPRLKLKKQFPSINIALDLRFANMYILNESRHLYLPLISFHKSSDPARGPVFTIPAHLVSKKQIHTYGYYFLGLLLKTQTMDLNRLYSWLFRK